MKLIITEKPSVAKFIASALGAKSGGRWIFSGERPDRFLVCRAPCFPPWMRRAMTSVSRSGAMTIFPFCRSRSAMCWHRAKRTHLKIYAP